MAQSPGETGDALEDLGERTRQAGFGLGMDVIDVGQEIAMLLEDLLQGGKQVGGRCG